MQTQQDVLSTIEIDPASQPVGSIILLHGLGADGNDFVPIVSELPLPKTLSLRFVFPNAPLKAVTINNGYMMSAWYDITSSDIHRGADMTGINASVKQIEKLIAREEDAGISANKIILAGFSQGAVIALTTGLHFSKRLGGILALSGYLPFSTTELTRANSINRDTPIFLGHGTQDTIVPYALGKIAYETLIATGYAPTWHNYPMAHSVCAQEIKDIGAWLQSIFAAH